MEAGDQMLSFAPDSPLFVRQLGMYSGRQERLGDFLQSMVKLMRQFQRDSAALSRSAQALGSFMRSGLGQSETNATVLPFVKKFGEIFGEIASSQEILSESLESTFSLPLENFFLQEISPLGQMQTAYTSLRDAGEASLQRYLQSDMSNFGRGASQGSLEQRAHDLVIHKRKFELARFDLVHKFNEVESRKSLEISEACVSGMYALRSHHRICENRFNSCDAYMAQLQTCQEEEKRNLASSVKPLEKKRRDMMAVLDAMVERVEMASSFLHVNDESMPPHLGGSQKKMEGNGKEQSSQRDVRTPSPTPLSTSSSFSSLSRMGYNFIGGLAKNMSGDRDRNRTVGNSGQSGGGSGIVSMTMEGRSGTGRRVSMLEHGNDGFGDGHSHGDSSQGDTCENCEARMKALDSSELSPFYHISAAVAPAGLVKQGYLWKKSDKQKLLESWKRQWFVLDETKMYFIKERPADGYSTFQVQTVCDLMLASVREVNDMDLPFCFKVSNANIDSIIVQAEGQRDYQHWLQEFRHAIERRLTSGQAAMHTSPKPQDTSPNQSRSSSSLVDIERQDIAKTKRELNASIISNILKNNPLCAECDRSNPPPEWVSLNLGCVVCIECSGVHRALGVHVSKMRSLKLDDLEPEEYEVLELLGNSMNNKVWECKLPPNFKKPSPSASHSVRDKYIRDKYELKMFLDVPDNFDLKFCAQEIVRACEINDIELLFKFIAVGGPACYIACDTFPLHVAARRDSSACCMLLLVSGCNVLEKDANDKTASEVAHIAGHEELSIFLSERENHVLTARSRSNSDSSLDKLVTGQLEKTFDEVKDQQDLQDMISKALSGSDEDADFGVGLGSQVTTVEDCTE